LTCPPETKPAGMRLLRKNARQGAGVVPRRENADPSAGPFRDCCCPYVRDKRKGTHDYVRRATPSLFAALEVKNGRVPGDLHASHRCWFIADWPGIPAFICTSRPTRASPESGEALVAAPMERQIRRLQRTSLSPPLPPRQDGNCAGTARADGERDQLPQ
jgi:hypothetical protein